MKIWGVLCFIGCIGSLDARVINAADRSDKDERAGVGIATHFEEESRADSLKDEKADLSSFLKENSESVISSKEETEKPEAFLIVNIAEKTTPPGGGLRLMDPKVINEQIVFPKAEVPWWDRWWNGVTLWLFGENLDT